MRRNRTRPIQYAPEGTILSRLNPLTNSVLVILATTILLLTINPFTQLIFLVIIIVLFTLSKIKLLRLQGMRFLLITSGLIGIIQLFFIHQGDALFFVFGIAVYSHGVQLAILYSSRFISVILISYLFILSTNPNEFVYSLMRLGLPYRFGFALINALRMLPISHQEIQRINTAQISRGARFKLFPVSRLILNTTQFFKVLLISMFKRVDALVYSLEGRGFGLSQKRTFLKTNRMKSIDWVVILLAAFFLGLWIHMRVN